MNKLTVLLCVLVVLLGSAGVVFAAKPEPDYISINGATTSYEFHPLPNGRTWFHQTAAGKAVVYINAESLPGAFTFDFEEWGEFD